MFCSKCGKKIADDSVFCPECGYDLKVKKTTSSTINGENFKSMFDTSLKILKKPSSYIDLLKETDPGKNKVYFFSLILLIPLISIILNFLNLSLFSNVSLKYIFAVLPISTVFKTILFSIFFNLAVLIICFYCIKLFAISIFKTNTEMTFDDMIRVSTLPVLYQLVFNIIGSLTSLVFPLLGVIILIMGGVLFFTTLFSGYKHLLPEFELLPIAFTVSIGIAFGLCILLAFSFISSLIRSSMFGFF